MQLKIRRKGSTRVFAVGSQTADALVRYGTFEYAEGSVSGAKPKATGRVARNRDATLAASSAQVEEAPLDEKTKAELVDYLRAGGERVDVRLSKDELFKQAKRYQRRDMRAEK